MFLFTKIFKITFLFIFLAELLSLFGYLLPDFNTVCFLVIIAITLIFSLYKLEYGLWILLTELFIGSKGYLFYFEYDGLVISIRIALWLIIMAVWLAKFVISLRKRKEAKLFISGLASGSFSFYFFILFIFIVWGIINGFLQGNSFNNIFFDFNGWLYFVLILPIYGIIKNKENINNLLQIFVASILWLSLKTFFLLFVFSHNIIGAVYDLYRWVRISGVGEITQIQGGFYRIFFQSHIFVLIGFFVFLMLLLSINRKSRLPAGNSVFSRILTSYFSLLTLFLSVTLITFSRSNWAGLLIGLLLIFIITIWQQGWKKSILVSGLILISLILSMTFIVAIVKFPYPRPTGGFATTALLSERISQITGEAGASSRWALLPELMSAIKKAPLIGKGFGATVTYQTSDPRIRQTSPTGEYTTYAFEWGWLDIWLKLGLFGLLAYLVLLSKICIIGLRQNGKWKMENKEGKIYLGLIIGLVVISIVSFFSPYMNHPLGIGYLLIVSAILETRNA